MNDEGHPDDFHRSGSADPHLIEEDDGTAIRFAPSAVWTRGEVASAGGRRTMVTRLEAGALWFSAGRSRSPWRHEVQVGPARVSATKGRFQVSAEADGGATITCLSGRTRIFAGLREPVELRADRTAAVSRDGTTLIVMERAAATDDEVAGGEATGERDTASARTARPVGATAGTGRWSETGLPPATIDVDRHVVPPLEPPYPGMGRDDDMADPSADPAARPTGHDPDPHRRRAGAADLIAAAALVAVLVAAAILFVRGGSDDVAAPPAPAPTTAPPPTAAPPSTAPSTTPQTTAAEPAPTTSRPQRTVPAVPAVASNPAGTAEGDLQDCRLDGDVVRAQVVVTQTGGGGAAFLVRVALVDDSGPYAQGTGTSSMLDGGSAEIVEVEIPIRASSRGSCELLAVQAV